jgi:hypothetical protein
MPMAVLSSPQYLVVSGGGGGGGDITVAQFALTSTDNATNGTHATGSNVTLGNKVVVACFRFANTDNDPFVAGDCTKTAGTSTLGAFSLLTEENVQYSASPGYENVGLWAADVTGSGTLTVTVAGTAGNYWGVSIVELASSTGWDGSYLEDTAIGANSADNTNAASGDGSSAGKAIFIGVVATTNDGTGSPLTVTPDGAFTNSVEEEDDATHAVGSVIYRIVGTGTTDSADWTLDSNLGWAAALVVIKGL